PARTRMGGRLAAPARSDGDARAGGQDLARGGVGRGRLLTLAPGDDSCRVPGRLARTTRPPRGRLLPPARFARGLRRRRRGRPTRSRILYVQMIGRGTRTFPNKSDCLIVDLVGATERHDLLTLPQLFGLGGAGALEDRTVTEALEREHAIAAPATQEAPLVAE